MCGHIVINHVVEIRQAWYTFTMITQCELTLMLICEAVILSRTDVTEILFFEFLRIASRCLLPRNTMRSADYAVARCLSVRHTPVLRRNG